jgi:hypothetical protein
MISIALPALQISALTKSFQKNSEMISIALKTKKAPVGA